MSNLPAPLWRANELAAVLGGATQGVIGDVLSVSIDTRSLEPGGLFFAIRGEARDGHDFVPAALEKGAAAVVVDAAHRHTFGADARLVVVEDVLAALERMARARRSEMTGPVIAVTGSVGKTTTKEILRTVLSRQGTTHASIASYNNHWGVPLTLARTPRGVDFGVFEIGMSNPFEILPLTAMVRPNVAIVTTVEPVHLAQFAAVEAIADAKGEVFSGLEPGGVAIINADNAHAGRLVAHAGASRAGRVVRFGVAAGAEIRLCDLHLHPDFSVVSADVFGISVTYRLGAPGRHLAMNSLAVLGAVHVIGCDLALAALSFQEFSTVDGRGKRVQLETRSGTFTLIDESYNANPSSMRAALAVAGGVPRGLRGRRIAVLGDMLELGTEGAKLHEGLVDAVVQNDMDVVFLCGSLMKTLWDALPADRRGAYAESSASLESAVLAAVQSGDVVMVKGSLGSRMGRIVKAITERFPAQAVVDGSKADEA
ncbi:MurF UDP-N-acetylmuramyl pentapeptide synthase [Rhabdaerophilaceae bacterium]